MDEESIIEVFEHEGDDEDKPLGIVSVRGTLTYAKIRVEIIEDGIFYEPFSFVYTKNNILNGKQEEKWRLKENKVYIKPSIDKQQRVSSKESCTNVEGSLLSQAEDNFKDTSPIETIKDKIPRDVLGKWMIECNRIRVKLSNATIPRDDKFELKVEDFCGKTIIRLWCNECGEPYGAGSTEAKVANVCLNNFFRSLIKSQSHEKRYYARKGLSQQDESINLSKIDDEAYIKYSLEVLKTFNDTTSGKHFCTLNLNIVVMNNMLIYVKNIFL